LNLNFLFKLGLFSISFLLATPAVSKPEFLEKNEVIDRVIQAYGGDKLKALKSLKVYDRYKVFSIDQGPNPEVNSISMLYSTLTVDFSSGKKSVKNWNQSVNGNRLSEILFDGETGWSINHLRGTHVENKRLGANVVGAGMMRMIDTILARRLQKQRDTATLVSHSTLLDKPIYTLSFEDENKEQYFIDIDASSGLILTMSRSEDRTTGSVYEYRKHKKVQGLTFATDMNLLVKGKPSFITTSRNIEVNQANQLSFAIPESSVKLKGMIDRSTMHVQKLADKVYLAGKGSSFSIFVDAGDFYVGAGGMSGINERLEAVNQFLGAEKPIKVQVIPDHHRGHLGAIKELEEMGVNMVIASQHRHIIESMRSDKAHNADFRVVDKKVNLANGLVEVHDIQTAHAENYLLFYIPSAKLIFSADHFGTNLMEALPGANNTIKTFRSEIKRLNLQVERYADAHGPRVLTNGDMEKVLTDYQIKSCPPEHGICVD